MTGSGTNVSDGSEAIVVRILCHTRVPHPDLLYWMTKWIEDGYTEEMRSRGADRSRRQDEAMAESGGLCFVLCLRLLYLPRGHLLIRLADKGQLAFCGLFWGGVDEPRKVIGPAIMKRLLRVDTIEGTRVELCGMEEVERSRGHRS